MAKTTISSLSYKIMADTSNFKEGMKASRTELGRLKKMVSDVETPLERYERKKQELFDTTKKLKDATELERRALEKLEKEYREAEAAADDLGDSSGFVVGKFTEMNSALELLNKAYEVGRFAVEKYFDVVRQARESLVVLERFGIAANMLGTFEVLSKRTGIGVEQLADAFKNLSVRLAEAVDDPGGEMMRSFQQLGFSIQQVQQMVSMQPGEQFRLFSEAIRAVGDWTTQLELADRIGGDAMANMLQQIILVEGAFTEATRMAEELNLNLSDQEIKDMERAAMFMERLDLAAQGFFRQLAVAANDSGIIYLLDAMTVLLGGKAKTGPVAAGQAILDKALNKQIARDQAIFDPQGRRSKGVTNGEIWANVGGIADAIQKRDKVGAQQAELGTIIKDEATKEQRARWEAERREKLTADERHAESMRKQDEIRDAILASPAIGLGNGGR